MGHGLLAAFPLVLLACAPPVLHSFRLANDDANPFWNPSEVKWRHVVIPEVAKLQAVQGSFRLEHFMPLRRDGWTEVASVSMHMAIASVWFRDLTGAKRILDIGSGSGALVAIFAELAREDAIVEGLEYDAEVAEHSRENLKEAAKAFWAAGNGQAANHASDTADSGIWSGDFWAFNTDGKLNGVYNVINVGFALRGGEVPQALMAAVAVGGKLGMPVCDEPLQVKAGKCEAHYNILVREAAGWSAPHVLDESINFVLATRSGL